MRTVVLGERPPELEALIEQRRAQGLDTFDEVWQGEYHMVPGPSVGHAVVTAELTVLLAGLSRRVGLTVSGPFNLGEPGNFRVPDAGVHRGRPTGTYLPTAAAVVEVLSSDDETFDKFPFYAARGVQEVVVADPAERVVRLWRLGGDGYVETDRSDLLGTTAAELTDQVSWP